LLVARWRILVLPGDLVGPQQVFRARRVEFQRDVMQFVAALGIGLPGRPGRQEVVTQAEACFQDAELPPALPALRQPVALQKDVAGLRLGAALRVVNVVMVQLTGHAAREVDARRTQGGTAQ
jgi:hypothetical protein